VWTEITMCGTDKEWTVYREKYWQRNDSVYIVKYWKSMEDL